MKGLLAQWGGLLSDYARLFHGGSRKAALQDLLIDAVIVIAAAPFAVLVIAALSGAPS